MSRLARLGLAAGLAGGLVAPFATKQERPLDAKYFSGGRVTLIEAIPVNHDTKLFRFKIPSDVEFNVPVCSTLACELLHSGMTYKRHYTAVNNVGDKGHIDLLIKLYPDGKMTPRIWELKPGDKMTFECWEKERWVPNKYTRVGFIAGGVGITPMLQIIREVITNPYDQTKMTLLFCNKTEDDILLRDELERIAFEYPGSLDIVYCLDKPAPGWTGETGYIDEAKIRKYMPGPKENSKLYVCGPLGFYKVLTGLKKTSTIMQWYENKSAVQPSVNVYDATMENDCLLAKMGYRIRQVCVF